MYIRVTEIPREGMDVTGARGNSWIGHLLDGLDPSPLGSIRILSATLFLSLEGRDLEANGTFVAEGEGPCDRCSEPVKVRIEKGFRTLFVPRDRGPSGSADQELLPEDLDLDGLVKYTGASNDRDLILQNIGGQVPTALRQEQLP